MDQLTNFFVAHATAYQLYSDSRDVERASHVQLKLIQLTLLIDQVSPSKLGSKMWQLFQDEKEDWLEHIRTITQEKSLAG